MANRKVYWIIIVLSVFTTQLYAQLSTYYYPNAVIPTGVIGKHFNVELSTPDYGTLVHARVTKGIDSTIAFHLGAGIKSFDLGVSLYVFQWFKNYVIAHVFVGLGLSSYLGFYQVSLSSTIYRQTPFEIGFNIALGSGLSGLEYIEMPYYGFPASKYFKEEMFLNYIISQNITVGILGGFSQFTYVRENKFDPYKKHNKFQFGIALK